VGRSCQCPDPGGHKRPSSRPGSEQQYDGNLIDDRTHLGDKAEKPKPSQSDLSIAIITPTDGERRIRNAAMLLELWALGEKLTDPFKCSECPWTGIGWRACCPDCGSPPVCNTTPEELPKPTLERCPPRLSRCEHLSRILQRSRQQTLREATREQVENFVVHLADWAEKNRDALLCQLNSYLGAKKRRRSVRRDIQGLHEAGP
jgi:hypothetical protein